jgi:hypothetical protein
MIHMRWARIDDMKKRGAKKDSAFYRKHGQEAGKDSAGFGIVPASVTVDTAAVEGGGGLARRLAPAGDMLEERIMMDGGDDMAAVEGVCVTTRYGLLHYANLIRRTGPIIFLSTYLI